MKLQGWERGEGEGEGERKENTDLSLGCYSILKNSLKQVCGGKFKYSFFNMKLLRKNNAYWLTSPIKTQRLAEHIPAPIIFFLSNLYVELF